MSSSVDIVFLQITTFDYGKKAENPIDHIRFYTKENPHKAEKIRKDQEWQPSEMPITIIHM